MQRMMRKILSTRQSIFDNVPRHDLKFVIGDLNAKVVGNIGPWQRVIGHRAFRSADLGSDHELVIAKIQLKLAAQGKKTKTPKLMDAGLLHPNLARDYQIKIANRFDVLSDLSCEPDVDHEWNGFCDAVYTAAEQTVSHQTSRYKCCISQGTLELIEHRRNAKKVKDQAQTEESKRKYSKQDKKVKKSAKHVKN